MKTARYLTLAALITLSVAFGNSAHATCGGANCWIQYQEANDSGYLGQNSSYNYNDTSYYGTQTATQTTYPYQYAYQPTYQPYQTHQVTQGYNYSNNQVIESFQRGNCWYVVKRISGQEYTTRTCN
jgi:hypothetical protein